MKKKSFQYTIDINCANEFQAEGLDTLNVMLGVFKASFEARHKKNNMIYSSVDTSPSK